MKVYSYYRMTTDEKKPKLLVYYSILHLIQHLLLLKSYSLFGQQNYLLLFSNEIKDLFMLDLINVLVEQL